MAVSAFSCLAVAGFFAGFDLPDPLAERRDVTRSQGGVARCDELLAVLQLGG
jgi:hypothetical protein